MAPRLLLLLQLTSAVAAASCLLAASCGPVDTAPLPPSRDVLVATAVAPAAGVPRAAAADNDTGVVPTMAAPDDVAAAAAVFRGARRFGPPRHLHLSDIPAANAPAATSSGADADAPAPAPSGVHAASGQSLVVIFSPVFFVLGRALFVAGLFKSADLYAAAKARREKARRVRPLDQDAFEAAGP